MPYNSPMNPYELHVVDQPTYSAASFVARHILPTFRLGSVKPFRSYSEWDCQPWYNGLYQTHGDTLIQHSGDELSSCRAVSPLILSAAIWETHPGVFRFPRK